MYAAKVVIAGLKSIFMVIAAWEQENCFHDNAYLAVAASRVAVALKTTTDSKLVVVKLI